MNPARDTEPLDDQDDAPVDHTVMVSRRSGSPLADRTVLRPPGPTSGTRLSGPPTDGTVMVSRRSSPPTDGTVVVARELGPPTDGTVMVSRRSDPPVDHTVMVSRRSGPPTDGTVMVSRRLGPPTDGTVVVPPSDPDGTVMVRRGRPSAGAVMADPVLRGRAGQANVPKSPVPPEERPRYTPRVVPQPPGPALYVMEGPTAVRGTAPLPSVAAVSRRTARAALVTWLVLSAACVAGIVWCAAQLFGG